jgi:hypothetical protein
MAVFEITYTINFSTVPNSPTSQISFPIHTVKTLQAHAYIQPRLHSKTTPNSSSSSKTHDYFLYKFPAPFPLPLIQTFFIDCPDNNARRLQYKFIFHIVIRASI